MCDFSLKFYFYSAYSYTLPSCIAFTSQTVRNVCLILKKSFTTLHIIHMSAFFFCLQLCKWKGTNHRQQIINDDITKIPTVHDAVHQLHLTTVLDINDDTFIAISTLGNKITPFYDAFFSANFQTNVQSLRLFEMRMCVSNSCINFHSRWFIKAKIQFLMPIQINR